MRTQNRSGNPSSQIDLLEEIRPRYRRVSQLFILAKPKRNERNHAESKMRPLAQIRLYMHRAASTLLSSSVVMYSQRGFASSRKLPVVTLETGAPLRHGVTSPAKRVLQVGKARVRLHDIVREVDQQLGEAALSCRVVAQYR